MELEGGGRGEYEKNMGYVYLMTRKVFSYDKGGTSNAYGSVLSDECWCIKCDWIKKR